MMTLEEALQILMIEQKFSLHIENGTLVCRSEKNEPWTIWEFDRGSKTFAAFQIVEDTLAS